MLVELLGEQHDIKQLLHQIGVDDGGVSILSQKSKIKLIHIKNMHVGAANILKQDALSVGADLAVPKGTVVAKSDRVDALLLATPKELKELAKKELAQPFGLKDIARALQDILKIRYPQKCSIMGVVNANSDSFFTNSTVDTCTVIKKIEQMIEDGATIIDIGAVSSRPGSTSVDEKVEYKRVKPIVDLISRNSLYEKASFSIDSYTPSVVEYALDSGFNIVNDITGLQDAKICKLVAKFDARAILMHMQGTPETMQLDPRYANILSEISQFFTTRVSRARDFGVEKIVLDVGIGFGKTVQDNLSLISNLEHFLQLELPLLVGASRKSLIGQIDNSSVEDRVGGTLALHIEAAKNGASILRVHDVKEHVQALAVLDQLNRYKE